MKIQFTIYKSHSPDNKDMLSNSLSRETLQNLPIILVPTKTQLCFFIF